MSSIDTALACPFAFWRERFFPGAARPSMDSVISPIEMGLITHEIWAGLWNIFRERGGTIYETLSTNWDALVLSASANCAALSDARSASQVADRKGKMLGAAATQDAIDASLAASGAARQRTEIEYVLPAINIGGVTFTGRADRVDFWTTARGDAAVVYDYKLGSSKKYKNSAQLAAYSLALAEDGVSVAGCCYLCCGDGKFCYAWRDANDDFKKIGGTSSRAPSVEETRSALSWISELVSSGRFEANYDSPMCPRCDYAIICRRSERRGEYETGGENSDESE
jgi:CRISPR/Cas system-associated exonuclease Cas4 (RecB family)